MGIQTFKMVSMTDKKTTEAVSKVLDESKKLNRKFKQNIDIVFNIKNVDLNIPKNRVDEEVVLPHGRGNEAKIALFASGELAVKSKKHVDLLIKPEEIEDISKDKKKLKKIADEHDFFIAEAPLMPTIGKTLGLDISKVDSYIKCSTFYCSHECMSSNTSISDSVDVSFLGSNLSMLHCTERVLHGCKRHLSSMDCSLLDDVFFLFLLLFSFFGKFESSHLLSVADNQNVTHQHRMIPGFALDCRKSR